MQLLVGIRGGSTSAILVRGTSGALMVNVLAYGLGFGVNVFLARTMGVDHYGIYIYVLVWLGILALIAKLGLDTTLLRYVATYQAQEAWDSLQGLLQWSNRLSLLVSLVVSGIGALVIWKLQMQLGQELTYTFWLSFGTLPLLTQIGLRQAALRSLKRVVRAQLPGDILRPLFIATLVGLLSIWAAHPVSGPQAMALNLLATFFSFMVATYWLHHYLPKSVKVSPPHFHSQEWGAVVLPFFLIAGINLVLKQTDTLMVGFFLGTTQAGVYATVSRVAMLILFGLQAVNAIVAPMISGFYAQERMQELQRLVTLAAYGILAISLPIGLGIVLGGKVLLSLFDPTFIVGYPALVILMIGQLVSALAGSVGFLMTMTGHQNDAARVIGGSALLNIVLNAILIPAFGIIGAAVSTALTTALWNIVMFIYVQKRLQINSTVFVTMKK